MLNFEWSDQYSVGNPLLDSQHREFIALCQKAIERLSDGTQMTPAEIHTLLHEMSEFAQVHFETEEAILEANGYGDLKRHKEEHDAYTLKLVDFLHRAMYQNINKDDIEGFLLNWWLRHVQGSDMACKDYLQSRP